MSTLVAAFNTLVTFLFGLVYAPLKWIGPLGSIVVISCLCGLLLIWIFGKVSNQPAIEFTRNRLSSELIGLRLFKDDLRVFFGIQFQILVWTLKYLRHSLFPMAILLIPTVILLIQFNLHYGARPLRPKEQTLVKVTLRQGVTAQSAAQITLQSPQNLTIETPAVHIENPAEVCWRVRATTPGEFDLTIHDGNAALSKHCVVSERWNRVAPIRDGGPWYRSLLYPGEAPIPSQSPIQTIEIRYPELDLRVIGRHVHWLVLFLVVSLAFGYACKGLLGVKI